MENLPSTIHQAIEQRGFAIIQAAYLEREVGRMGAELDNLLAADNGSQGALRNSRGGVFGARNLIDLYPQVVVLWQRATLTAVLRNVLGDRYGLVRALYFDKPPGQGWTLPWHRDETIAVRDNQRATKVFTRPTRKAGVPHVVAPRDILEQMLTLRIHLDDVTGENGPLKVLPGSHRLDSEPDPHAAGKSIFAGRGDVLAMRPLLLHGSAAARQNTECHRRILHLEFSGQESLPDGYTWNKFIAAP